MCATSFDVFIIEKILFELKKKMLFQNISSTYTKLSKPSSKWAFMTVKQKQSYLPNKQ